MMKLLKSPRLAIKAPCLFVAVLWLSYKARRSAGEGKYRTALDYVNKIQRISGGKLSTNFILMKALLFYKISRYDDAESLVLKVRDRLKRKPFYLNKEDRKRVV